MLSGILTSGGTILGTSRDKPHQMEIGGEIRDMTGAIVDTVPPATISTPWSASAAAARRRTPCV